MASAAIAEAPGQAAPDTTDTASRDWHGKGTRYLSAPTDPLGPREFLDRVNSPSVRATITDAVRQIVEIEGPIELDRLARDVGRRFGLERVRAKPKAFITECVPAELISSSRLGTFVWPRELQPGQWRGYRTTPDGADRPIGDIAPEEIINAMADVCRRRALDTDSVLRETMGRFGISRMGSTVRERLDACMALAVRTGRLIRDGDSVRAGA